MENGVSLFIILVCTVMSSYFSATETAFLSMNRIRMKNMAEKGNKRAALTLKMAEKYDTMLSTILIGNNIVNILSASLATVIFVDLLGNDIGPSISTLVTTVVVLIFGEISPKSIAKESPEKIAMFSAPVLKIFMLVLTPVNILFSGWKKLLSMLFKVSEDAGITEEELLTIVEEAEQGGGIDKDESTLIRSAIEFNELETIDILTPRIDVVAVSENMPKEEIAEVFAKTGYSRLPIYKENMDQISGILYQKDFHNYIFRTEEQIADYIRPVIYTTKNKKIDELMKELQKEKLHFAIVVDEFGSMLGIVTLEDILEELVGEIWDEHDTVVQEMVEVSETEYLVSGKTNIEKVFECFGKEAEFEVHTVSGWVMEQLERIPQVGDVFEAEGLLVKVLCMTGRRVEQVSIKVAEIEEG